MSILLTILVLLLLAVPVRALAILPRRSHRPKKPRTGPCKIAIFLGSGGHTSESLQLLRSLPASRYYPRLYIHASSDPLSPAHAHAYEASLSSLHPHLPPAAREYSLLALPRARNVHQPLWRAVPRIGWSLGVAVWLVGLRPGLGGLMGGKGGRGEGVADVLLLNGPGTCVPVLMAVYVSKFLGLPAPRTIYVESFARVRSLSLTGKLVRPFVDRFVVQWPEALGKGRGECRGWLV